MRTLNVRSTSFQVLKERGRQNMKRSLELAEKLIHQSYLEKEEYMELLGSYQDKETVVCLGQRQRDFVKNIMEIKYTCVVLSNLPISVKTTAITAVSAGTIKMPVVTVSQRRDFRLL